ncbi:Sulphate transporter [Modestobacter italicus]|uniref:Sulphate transporter n=1 Tax=Modestobacter italicus (strain DSM 44449 / CECT 9708 / BC 501) TaxID=2732864 RepID=I4EYH7_MODI5|nr:Sulphate transporter [Modestobacter marinus]
MSVPDGLAAAALAGVNPVYGLYTSATAPVVGSALASSQLVQIATTSASALAAGQAVAAYPTAERDDAMFLLVVLSGVFLALFGVLRLGRLVRYVSHAVMTGFLFGVSAVLVLDQLAPLVGYAPQGPNEVVQFVDLLTGIGGWNWTAVAVGCTALAIMAALARTRLATLSSLIALVVPALVVWVFSLDVERVVDVSPIPRGLPALSLPDLSLISADLLLAAAALAAVVAVQGAGVSQSVENPDGSAVSTSGDMLAQGAANVAAGLFSGIPAGGSVGQTALNVSVGARSRWAGISGGVWMLVIIVALPGVIGQVPMTVLGALMIVAGAGAIKPREALSIWRTSTGARASILVTFVATLLVSVPVAVAVGVGLSALWFLVTSSADVRVRRLVPDGRGGFTETDPPEVVPSGEVVVLDVHGSLFFAGARTLADALPAPAGGAPVVVLRLRGHSSVGATLVAVLANYAESLEDAGGHLYLSGLDRDVAEQLRRAGKLDIGDSVHLAEATNVLGASTYRALAHGEEWLRAMSRPDGAGGPAATARVRAPQSAVLPEGALRAPRHRTPRPGRGVTRTP